MSARVSKIPVGPKFEYANVRCYEGGKNVETLKEGTREDIAVFHRDLSYMRGE